MKILTQFAHPAFHKSRVNQLIIKAYEDVPDLTFNDLYQEYPDFDIEIAREQALMEAHDLFVFQFPLFWYSTPSLLKEWQDLVLEHGWAYGHKGNALKDKYFLCSITAGGPQEAYTLEGFHKHTLNQLLAALWQTARLCKMKVLPPFVVHGSHRINQEEIIKHQKDLHQFLQALQKGQVNLEDLRPYAYLNDYINEKAGNYGG